MEDLASAFGIDDVAFTDTFAERVDPHLLAQIDSVDFDSTAHSGGPANSDALSASLGIEVALEEVASHSVACPDPRPNPADASSRVVPAGVANHSVAHMTLLARHKQKMRRKQEGTGDFNRLANCWDRRTLRYGDLAEASSRNTKHAGERKRTHSNTYTIPGLVKAAFRGISCLEKVLTGEVDVEAHRRQQETMMTVSSLLSESWKSGANRFDESTKGHRIKYFRRHHDSTPLLLRFGQLQSEIAPHARYLKKLEADREGGYARWTTCTYGEYCKSNPKMVPQSGVLEVFAQTSHMCSCDYMGNLDLQDDNWPTQIRPQWQDFMHAPCILASGTASNYLTALSNTHFDLSVQRLKQESEATDISMLDEMPDGAKPNKRCKTYVATELLECENVIMDEHNTCCVHKLHNFTTKSIGEKYFIGHLHAIHSVWSIQSRRNQLLSALTSIVSDELVVHDGEPPEECTAQTEHIIDNCLRRAQDKVRAAAEEDLSDIAAPSRGSTFLEGIDGYRTMVNGDKRIQRAQHHCNGCCRDVLL